MNNNSIKMNEINKYFLDRINRKALSSQIGFNNTETQLLNKESKCCQFL